MGIGTRQWVRCRKYRSVPAHRCTGRGYVCKGGQVGKGQVATVVWGLALGRWGWWGILEGSSGVWIGEGFSGFGRGEKIKLFRGLASWVWDIVLKRDWDFCLWFFALLPTCSSWESGGRFLVPFNFNLEHCPPPRPSRHQDQRVTSLPMRLASFPFLVLVQLMKIGHFNTFYLWPFLLYSPLQVIASSPSAGIRIANPFFPPRSKWKLLLFAPTTCLYPVSTTRCLSSASLL